MSASAINEWRTFSTRRKRSPHAKIYDSGQNFRGDNLFRDTGIDNALNYINLMHQIRRIITVAQLHVCRRVLLDMRGIVRVLEAFVQLLGFKLAL